ncbi:outer membrane beta-barrel protein [Spirosoma radiotolerans]|nr:outer membrane beta-barrel protein [Spirosoma radiotolerans]
MKTIVCTLAFVLLGFSAVIAQTEKGRWTVGAQVGNFQYSTHNGYNSFSGSISPSAGYFVANNLVVGTGVPLSLNTSKYYNSNGEVHYRSTGIGLAPYVRYYVGSNKLKPYVGVSYTYSSTRQRSEMGYQTLKSGGFTSIVSPSIGVAYFINRSVALSAGLNYVWERYNNGNQFYDASGNPIENTTSTSKFLSLTIGFQIFLGK